MKNYKPKKRIIKSNSNDVQFDQIRELLESEDPALDEPVICALRDTYLYRTEFGVPHYNLGMPDYYETCYRTIGEETKMGGSIPLTLRELRIAQIIGLTDGIHAIYAEDEKQGNIEEKTVSKNVVVGYERDMEPHNGTFVRREIEQKPALELSDMDMKRLEERKAEIARIKSSNGLDAKGIIVLHDSKRSNLRESVDYEMEVTAKQAALMSVLLSGDRERFRTYEEIQAQSKTSISFDSIAKAIEKLLGRGEER